MNCKNYAFALAILFSLSGNASAQSFAEKVETSVQRGIDGRIFPGAVVVAHVPGKLDYARAFGRHTYDPKSPEMQLDTIFDLASVTKVSGTTPAALLALQDGNIRLGDTVAKYLPAFSAKGKGDVTLRQLLTHTSGLKSYANAKTVDAGRRADETQDDALIRYYCDLDLSYKPGLGSTYSCINMQTMARVVETATGKSLHDLLSERIWKPLGMRDTGYILTAEQKTRCAPVGTRADGSTVQGIIHDPLANYYGADDHCPGNAGLYSTAGDLGRYCAMMLAGGEVDGKRVLAEWVVNAATTRQTPSAIRSNRGLGWILYTDRDSESAEASSFGHSGYTGTYLWLDRKTGSYVVFLSNRVILTDGKEGNQSVCSAISREIIAAVREVSGQQLTAAAAD